MLLLWKKKEGSSATYGNVVRICRENGNTTCAGMIVKLWKEF